MSGEKMDMAKVLAILAQPKEAPPPLENVERRTLDIQYITKGGALEARKLRIFIPENTQKPMPLIYVPHYEMGEDAEELRSYLSEGWAVACPTQAPADFNSKLAGDDLIFNNAALYALRKMDEFDKRRIALVGGSAGGYCTLMLTGQNLGICASIANGPIANTYFNLNHYFPMAQALNLKALAKIAEESKNSASTKANGEAEKQTPLDLMKKLSELPIPFIAALCGQFAPSLENYPDINDVEKWEALTGTGIVRRFSSPVMVNHSTSDVLVPVDQISRQFTYIKPGDSLPDSFDARLPEALPGKLKYSLEERLPKEETRTLRIIVPEKAEEESVLPYDAGKRFNLNIFDDGPIEGYGSHSSRMDVGRRLDVPYLKEMLELSSAKTNVLTPDMLRFLLELYMGNSPAVTAHERINDTVYGSLAVYKEKACMELAEWKANNGGDELLNVFNSLIGSEEDKTARAGLEAAMKEILEQI